MLTRQVVIILVGKMLSSGKILSSQDVIKASLNNVNYYNASLSKGNVTEPNWREYVRPILHLSNKPDPDKIKTSHN